MMSRGRLTIFISILVAVIAIILVIHFATRVPPPKPGTAAWWCERAMEEAAAFGDFNEQGELCDDVAKCLARHPMRKRRPRPATED